MLKVLIFLISTLKNAENQNSFKKILFGDGNGYIYKLS